MGMQNITRRRQDICIYYTMLAPNRVNVANKSTVPTTVILFSDSLNALANWYLEFMDKLKEV